MLGTSVMALRCTFSKLSMFVIRYGLHSGKQISRCGLMYALYSVIKDYLSMYLNDLFTIPRNWMAFFEAFWHVCNSKHNAY